MWRLEAPNCYQTQQATLSHFFMIQLLLILMTNAGRLEDRKKKGKKTKHKQTKKKRKVRPLMDFVIMENEIRAASKHVPVDSSKDGHSTIYEGPVVQTLDSAIRRINRYPADK